MDSTMAERECLPFAADEESSKEQLKPPVEDVVKGGLWERLRVAQDSIKFLKREHASMLEGLHDEIELLHHKCRDLQYRCEAEGCILPDNDFFRCSPKMLELKVSNLMKENADLRMKLAESHQAIDILDQKEKLALWQHHQELEQRDGIILRLEKELESKCGIIAQMNSSSQGARRKKGNFWRRFSFSTSSNHPSTSFSSVSHPKLQHAPTRIDHLSREDLPSEIQNSLPSYEHPYQSYSSYSSLSDKSVSDDEGFAQRCTTDKDPKDKRHLTVKLPPISNLPLVSSRQLVRHQLRIHSLAASNKVTTSDTLAIDQIPSPEVSVKRLSKT